jgi:hypothetical protein
MRLDKHNHKLIFAAWANKGLLIEFLVDGNPTWCPWDCAQQDLRAVFISGSHKFCTVRLANAQSNQS